MTSFFWPNFTLIKIWEKRILHFLVTLNSQWLIWKVNQKNVIKGKDERGWFNGMIASWYKAILA